MKVEVKITPDNGDEEYVIKGNMPTDKEIDFVFPIDKDPENFAKREGAKWMRDLFK